MAFDGVPIGISAGLPVEGRFLLAPSFHRLPRTQGSARRGRDVFGPKRAQPLRQSGLPYNRQLEYDAFCLSKKLGAVHSRQGQPSERNEYP